MTILFFGDIVGKTGRQAAAKVLPELRRQHQPDLVIANVENLAHGKGVTLSTLNFMVEQKVDFFTSGNHVFDKPEAVQVFQQYADRMIRPANISGKLPDGRDLPGAGWKTIEVKGEKIIIINLLGEVFMEKQFDYGKIANPFLALDQILDTRGTEARVRIVDFHAEATSEKRGLGLWADGRVSAFLGTHTHVQTADAQILPGGTGYLTDCGMTGAASSIIGVSKESALKRFLAQGEIPPKASLEVAETGAYEVGFAVLQIDEQSGKCQNIKAELRIVT